MDTDDKIVLGACVGAVVAAITIIVAKLAIVGLIVWALLKFLGIIG